MGPDTDRVVGAKAAADITTTGPFRSTWPRGNLTGKATSPGRKNLPN
jgi:hypothetical protein